MFLFLSISVIRLFNDIFLDAEIFRSSVKKSLSNAMLVLWPAIMTECFCLFVNMRYYFFLKELKSITTPSVALLAAPASGSDDSVVSVLSPGGAKSNDMKK